MCAPSACWDVFLVLHVTNDGSEKSYADNRKDEDCGFELFNKLGECVEIQSFNILSMYHKCPLFIC